MQMPEANQLWSFKSYDYYSIICTKTHPGGTPGKLFCFSPDGKVTDTMCDDVDATVLSRFLAQFASVPVRNTKVDSNQHQPSSTYIIMININISHSVQSQTRVIASSGLLR